MVDFRSLRNAEAQSNLDFPIKESPSQTAGPYVHIGCLPNFVGVNGVYPKDLTINGALPDGDKITIKGFVYDGDGAIAKDIMIESWQANSAGDLKNGIWRRMPTDLETGEFKLETIMPGSVDGNSPYINLWIVARGINIGLNTRIYFEDNLDEKDMVWKHVPKERQFTLIAKRVEGGYKFDIRLQGSLEGEDETVFFDI
ncbi:MAG: protocatechuate 3,4-dioxygenase subunit alpha [Hyphomicrobiales bacterium]|nr:protocatechuate 3,4-dioxygenase subunit alpha [Hyphomicrobiales bacterium]PCH51542.1 MAG: protocatechuate 3,4-dioxygenase subunit alpha [Hyphomicrobiales bacterium]